MFEMANSDGVKCRLCRKKDDYYIDVFDPAGTNNLLVWKVIKEFTELEISKGDGLPSAICARCMGKLTEFKTFKTECIKARIEFLTEMANEGIVGPPSDALLPLNLPMTNIVVLPSSGFNTASCETEETDPLHAAVDVKPVLKNGVIVEDQHSGYKKDQCSSECPNMSTARSPENERPLQPSENLSPSSSNAALSPRGGVNSSVDVKRIPVNKKGQDDVSLHQEPEVGRYARTCYPGRKLRSHLGLSNSSSVRMVPNPYHGGRTRGSWQIVSMSPDSATSTPCVKRELISHNPKARLSESSRCFSSVTNDVNRACLPDRTHSRSEKVSVAAPKSTSRYEVVKPSTYHIKKEKPQGNRRSEPVLKDCWVVLNDIFPMNGLSVNSSAAWNQKRSSTGVEKHCVGRAKRRRVKSEPCDIDGESESCVSGGYRRESDGKNVRIKRQFKRECDSALQGGRARAEKSTIACHTPGRSSFTHTHKAGQHNAISHPIRIDRDAYCTLCNRAFLYPYLLRLHNSSHVAGLPFRCNKCPCGFKSQIALTKHTLCIHS